LGKFQLQTGALFIAVNANQLGGMANIGQLLKPFLIEFGGICFVGNNWGATAF
jgi:hypothetical protein